ncbi:MAG TPA: hypothetical protein VJN43_09125 [Bryobacteraceae bacterium]|nr:hypothetical protein [Bryobacteraceae bacterium]
MPAARRILYYSAPLILFVLFYWRGLTIYFYQDDFGWLNIRHDLVTWHDLGRLMFAPKAHGNMRPWSENGFFLLFSTLFGADPLPFRIWVFITQCANLLLLGAIVRQITGDRVCAFWAQVLWIFNANLAIAASWTSIYNQFQYIFFILLAFYLFLRGRYIAQWIVFLLGFGSLEVNVVFPALACLYAILFARPLVKKTLPMFAASGAYVALHFIAAPHAAVGVYALHFDWRMILTLWSYWTLALGPAQLAHFTGLSGAWAVTLLLTAAAVYFVVCRVRQNDWFPAFALGWFVILLAPLLPLRDHISDYYLTGPVIGLALLGTWALRRYKWAGLAFAAVYLAVSIPAAWLQTGWQYARAKSVEDLLGGVQRARALHPGKAILLAGVNTDLFFAGILDVPFRALEIPQVYLAPGSETTIQAPADLVSKFVLPEGVARRVLDENKAVVYDASGKILRNVTSSYRGVWRNQPPSEVNPGDPIFEGQLSGEWMPAQFGSRRMGSKASVRMAGPRTPGEQLHLGFFCEHSPMQLTIEVAGTRAVENVTRCDAMHTVTVPLPQNAGNEINVQIEAQPAWKVIFGYLEVR